MYLCIFYQNQIQCEIVSLWSLLSFINDDERFDELLHEEELEDLINFLPLDEEEFDSEGLDSEESTVEQTCTEESTAEQTSTDADEFTVG
jgi:hypothetical protein